MASEKNPLSEYLTEKTATAPNMKDFVFAGGRGGNLASYGRTVAKGLGQSFRGENIGKAIGGAGIMGGIGLAGLAAQKVVDAITKANDFKQMLAYDAELAQMHQEEPHLVNQMFSTLRTFNPAFTKDPVVASHYVKQMTMDPSQAAGKAELALQSRDKTRPSVNVGDMMMRGAGAGGGQKKK